MRKVNKAPYVPPPSAPGGGTSPPPPPPIDAAPATNPTHPASEEMLRNIVNILHSNAVIATSQAEIIELALAMKTKE
jgi:hypothetical protein